MNNRKRLEPSVLVYLVMVLSIFIQLFAPIFNQVNAAYAETNTPTGKIEIKNEDDQQRPVNGGKFVITKSDDSSFKREVDITQDGKTDVDNLDAGQYVVTQEKVPGGYQPTISTTQQVTVEADKTATVNFTNATIKALPLQFTKVDLTKPDGQAFPNPTNQGTAFKLTMQFNLPSKEGGYAAGSQYETTLPTRLDIASISATELDGHQGTYAYDNETHVLTIKLTKNVTTAAFKISATGSFTKLGEHDPAEQKLVFQTYPTDTTKTINFRSGATPVMVKFNNKEGSFNATTFSGQANFNLDGATSTPNNAPKWTDKDKQTPNSDFELKIHSDFSDETIDDQTVAQLSESLTLKSGKVDLNGHFIGEMTTLVADKDYHVVFNKNKTIAKIYLTKNLQKGIGYQLDFSGRFDRKNSAVAYFKDFYVYGDEFLDADGDSPANAYDYLDLVNFGVPLRKSVSVDSNFKNLNWTVQINTIGNELQKGYELSDQFGMQQAEADGKTKLVVDPGQSLDTKSFKVHEAQIDKTTGKVTPGADVTTQWLLKQTGSDQFTLTYQGPEKTNKGYVLTYNTQLTSRESRTVQNNVKDSDGNSAKATTTLSAPNTIEKQSSKIDFFNHQMMWQITGNTLHDTMFDGTFIDVFPKGVKSLASSDPTTDYQGNQLGLSDADKTDGMFVVAYGGADGKTAKVLQKGTDYTLSQDTTAVTNAANAYNAHFNNKIPITNEMKGFVVKLTGDYKKTSDQIVIYNQTKLDQQAIADTIEQGQKHGDTDAQIQAAVKAMLNNHAYYFFSLPPGGDTWGGGDSGNTPSVDTDSMTGAKKAYLSGASTTSPNRLTWGVLLNQQGLKYGNLHLSDPITFGNKNFDYHVVPGSFKFYRVTGTNDFESPVSSQAIKLKESIDQKATTPITAANSQDQAYLPTNAPNEWIKQTDGHEELNLDFAKLDTNRVWVTFEVERNNQWYYNDADLVNTATVSDKASASTIPDFTPSASGAAANQYPVIQKSSDGADKNEITWHLNLYNIQDNARTLTTPEIVDTFNPNGTGAQVDMTSFNVTLTTSGESPKTLVQNKDYEIEQVNQGSNSTSQFKIVFKRSFGEKNVTPDKIKNYQISISYKSNSQYSGTVFNTSTVSSKSYGTMPVEKRTSTAEGYAIVSGWSSSDIQKLGNIKIEKYDASGTALKPIPLAGAVFELKTSDNKTFKATTDQNGIAEFAGFPAGANYWLRELTPPAGYSAKTMAIPAEFKSTDQNYPIEVKNLNGDTETTVSLKNDSYQMKFTKYNDLYKQDGSDKANFKLPGAVYQLNKGHYRNANDPTSFVKDEVIATHLITNENGEIIVNNQTQNRDRDPQSGLMKELTAGTYQLQEVTAPDHYRGDAADQRDHPTGHLADLWHSALKQGTVTFTLTADKPQANQLAADNVKKPGKLIVPKEAAVDPLYDLYLDSKKDHEPFVQPAELAGTEFALNRYRKGHIDRTYTWQSTIKKGEHEADFAPDNLYEGKYYLHEVKAPAGYVIPDALAKGQDVQVTGDETKTVATVQEPIFKRSIKLIKTSAYDDKVFLKGATFSLYNNDGKLIAKNLVTNDQGELTTSALGANDKALPLDGKMPELPIGQYYLEETKAPNGYYTVGRIAFKVEQTKAQQTLTVSQLDKLNKDKPVTLKVKDSPILPSNKGQVTIHKYGDKDQTQPLANAVFILSHVGGGYSVTLTTDDKGNAIAQGIPVGSYILKEVSAPAGYDLNKTYQQGVKVDITDNQFDFTYNVVDLPTSHDVPDIPVNPDTPNQPNNPDKPGHPGTPSTPGHHSSGSGQIANTVRQKLGQFGESAAGQWLLAGGLLIIMSMTIVIVLKRQKRI